MDAFETAVRLSQLAAQASLMPSLGPNGTSEAMCRTVRLTGATTIELSEATFPWESDYNIKNKVVLVRVGPGPTQ